MTSGPPVAATAFEKNGLFSPVLVKISSAGFSGIAGTRLRSQPTGVGKTFIAHALGHVACGAGFRVRVHRADELLRLLRQSRMDNSRDALMTELTTVDLLVVDDFALEPMTREESRDVYQLFVDRNARLPTTITSNHDTDEWLALFDDALLAQSAVDRFKNNAYDLVIDGEPYRPRLKPVVDDQPPPAAPVVERSAPGRRRRERSAK